MQFRQSASLESYATRVFALMGSALRERFPFCTPENELSAHQGNGDGSLVSFAHYDYLGLAGDERIAAATCDAVRKVGTGAGASRLVGGELALHRTFEREMSDFLGVEDTLSLVSGYGTNVSLVSHLLSKDDLILLDDAAHNSIMVGSQISRAQSFAFGHGDLEHLEAILHKRRSEFCRVLVIVEGLYSMDGDIPDLPRLIEICRRHSAWLMVDEAHSIGILGANGRGITEHFGVAASEIDLIVGTLSKAFVSCGGFVSAKKSVIEWLRYSLPGFVYSVGISPPAVAAAREALSILRAEPARAAAMRANSAIFVEAARKRGLDVGSAIGVAIVPVLLPDIRNVLSAANAALDAGYFVPPIVQIGVPKDKPRLRCFVTARHTPDQIEGLLDVLASFALGLGDVSGRPTKFLALASAGDPPALPGRQ